MNRDPLPATGEQYDDATVIGEQKGAVGHLCLNRPQALNALDLPMVQTIRETAARWSRDPSIECVVLSSSSSRAFCAGSDVKSVYYAGREGDRSVGADLFRAEYSLDHEIANYPKPWIALIDGITMGGGVGLSVWGSHRIATPTTRLAMPETAIGFFPDVGASLFLSKLGPLGRLIGLSGYVLNAKQVVALGLATHFVDGISAGEMIERINRQGFQRVLRSYQGEGADSGATKGLSQVAERCFRHSQLSDVMQSLRTAAAESGSVAEVATEVLAAMSTRSPTSLMVSDEAQRRGRTLRLDECLVMEYRISQACLLHHDFYEGVQAVLVDKNHSPNWSPDSLDEVRKEDVERFFEEPVCGDLQL